MYFSQTSAKFYHFLAKLIKLLMTNKYTISEYFSFLALIFGKQAVALSG